MKKEELKFDANSFLSNYFPCCVYYRKNYFSSSEAVYQSEKFDDWSIKRVFAKLEPDETRKVAHRLTRLQRPDWDTEKETVMLEVLRAKFAENSYLADALLNTGDIILIEDTTGWCDNYWGECLCERCRDLPHENRLGKLLMQVRQELRDGTLERPHSLLNDYWDKPIPVLKSTTFALVVTNPHSMNQDPPSGIPTLCTPPKDGEIPEKYVAHVYSLSPDGSQMIISCGGKYYMIRLNNKHKSPLQDMETVCGECTFCFAEDLGYGYDIIEINWRDGFCIVTFTDHLFHEYRDFLVPM